MFHLTGVLVAATLLRLPSTPRLAWERSGGEVESSQDREGVLAGIPLDRLNDEDRRRLHLALHSVLGFVARRRFSPEELYPGRGRARRSIEPAMSSNMGEMRTLLPP